MFFFGPALTRLGYGIGLTDLLAGARTGSGAGAVTGSDRVGHGLRIGGIHGAILLRFIRDWREN